MTESTGVYAIDGTIVDEALQAAVIFMLIKKCNGDLDLFAITSLKGLFGEGFLCYSPSNALLSINFTLWYLDVLL